MRIGDEMVVIEQLIKAAELKVLCARAADALDIMNPDNPRPDLETAMKLVVEMPKLIKELREASK